MAIMSYNQIKQKMGQGVFPAILVLHGEDSFQARELIRHLKSHLEGRGESPLEYLEWDLEAEDAEISASLTTLPLGTIERLVVIHNPESSILKTYSKVNNPRLFTVFFFDRKLKKKELTELGEYPLVECRPLKGRELVRWMQEEAACRGNVMPGSAAEYLRFSCGDDVSLLSQEIEKASLYLGNEKKEITVDTLKVVGSRTTDRTLFELVDAVAERKASVAFVVLQDLLIQGKPLVLLISMLSRHFLQMLEVYWLLREGVSPARLPQVMDIHPFVAKKLLRQIRTYQLAEIEKIVGGLLELDLSLKKGQGTPELLMTSFLGSI